jgi:hypothetical protein
MGYRTFIFFIAIGFLPLSLQLIEQFFFHDFNAFEATSGITSMDF